MKDMATATTRGNEQEISQIGVNLLQITFRASLVLTLLITFMIGLWAIAALAGGAISSGGPFEMVRGWFTAIGGA